MTANGNDSPQNPAEEAARTGANLGRTAKASATEDLKGRAQDKAAQAKDAVNGHAGQAARATQEKVGQAKHAVSGLTSKAQNATPDAFTSPPAVRGASVGAAAIGLGAALAVWLLRRRARRNANPWHVAAESAKSQIKSVRREAKSGLKTARKRSRARAAAQVAAAKTKARDARSRAKSWK